jgi:hypothetical protein
MKQIKFKDLENDVIHGGILLDNGDVVCGCCGGLLEGIEKNITWELLEVYDTWINLDEEICGDDLE